MNIDNNINIFYIMRSSAIAAECLAAVLGIVFFYKYKNTILKYFLFYLIYIVFIENFGIYLYSYLSKNPLGDIDNNSIVYNIYNIVSFSYFLLLYRYFITNKSHKKWIYSFFIIYLVTVFINAFFENYLKEPQTIPYIVASILLIITIVFYFIELLNSRKVLHVKHNLLFWIAVGLLIYYIGNIPFRIVRGYYAHLADISILFLINISLTIVMNLCFIIGFIWSNKKQLY